MTHRRWGTAGLSVAAVLMSAVMVWQGSGAAFSGSTDNPANNWAAGTVSLTDDANGVALFSQTQMKPGSGNYKCIRVTYTGTVPANVRMYLTGATGGLVPYLNFSAWIHPLGEGCSQHPSQNYITTFSNAVAVRTNWETGIYNRRMLPGESYSYGISNSLPASAPDAAQGQSAMVNFVWEARSTP